MIHVVHVACVSELVRCKVDNVATDADPHEDLELKVNGIRDIFNLIDDMQMPLAADLISSLCSFKRALGIDEAASKRWKEAVAEWRKIATAVLDFIHARVVDISDAEKAKVSESGVMEITRLAEWGDNPQLDRIGIETAADVIKLIVLVGTTPQTDSLPEARDTHEAFRF